MRCSSITLVQIAALLWNCCSLAKWWWWDKVNNFQTEFFGIQMITQPILERILAEGWLFVYHKYYDSKNTFNKNTLFGAKTNSQNIQISNVNKNNHFSPGYVLNVVIHIYTKIFSMLQIENVYDLKYCFWAHFEIDKWKIYLNQSRFNITINASYNWNDHLLKLAPPTNPQNNKCLLLRTIISMRLCLIIYKWIFVNHFLFIYI